MIWEWILAYWILCTVIAFVKSYKDLMKMKNIMSSIKNPLEMSSVMSSDGTFSFSKTKKVNKKEKKTIKQYLAMGGAIIGTLLISALVGWIVVPYVAYNHFKKKC